MPDKEKKQMGRPSIYPFAKLAVNESFLLDEVRASWARAAATTYRMRHPGWNYKSKKEGDQVRFTRTA